MSDADEYLQEKEVDALKKSWEINDHWQLRRDFMLAHRERFPKNRLMSLAQMFVNVETLGTKYDKEMMDLVESLSHDVEFLISFRELKNKLGGTKFAKPVPSRNKSLFNTPPGGYNVRPVGGPGGGGGGGGSWSSNYSGPGNHSSCGLTSDSSLDSSPASSVGSSPAHSPKRPGSGFLDSYLSESSPSSYIPGSRASYSTGEPDGSERQATGTGQHGTWTAGNSSLASYETASYQSTASTKRARTE